MYEFDNQTLVFGYSNNQFVGMFVSLESRQFTKSEMFDIFDNQVDYMVTVPITEVVLPELTHDSSEEDIMNATSQIIEDCREIYDRAVDLKLKDSECKYQISKIVH